MDPVVEALLNTMLASTVHRELISSDEVSDWILDLRLALSDEPNLIPA